MPGVAPAGWNLMDAAEREGLVIRAQSGFYDVETAEGTVRAVLRGLLRRGRRSDGLCTLGDRVLLEMLAPDERGDGAVEATIREVRPRSSSLSRRAPGSKGVWARDVVVANVDVLAPVFAISPEPHFRLLDRFLALAEIDQIEAVVVINKVDLGIPAEVEARLAVYTAIGYPILRVSAHTGEGLEALRAALSNRLSALVGPSGVGKSSLMNALEPGLGLKVGGLSQSVGKGKHTTRVGELHPLSFGGRVADTPGLRELGLWDVDPAELEWAFVEFRPFLQTCRFDDCSHLIEPGCAVRSAVDAGQIDAERYASFVRMLSDRDS